MRKLTVNYHVSRTHTYEFEVADDFDALDDDAVESLILDQGRDDDDTEINCVTTSMDWDIEEDKKVLEK